MRCFRLAIATSDVVRFGMSTGAGQATGSGDVAAVWRRLIGDLR